MACGFSSYFTIPWVIGLIGMLWLSLSSVVLTETMELEDPLTIIGVSGLLVSFPALASTFAYVFTMDGYMMALFLAVLSVLFTQNIKRLDPGRRMPCLQYGNLPGVSAVCHFAVRICDPALFMEEHSVKEKVQYALRYLGMGIAGAVLYYVILQILLKLQGKVLDTYQGINSMEQGGSGQGLLTTLKGMYYDFLAFTLHGDVLVNNIFSFAACAVLLLSVVFLLVRRMFQRNGGRIRHFSL